jgi:hypothetical protein
MEGEGEGSLLLIPISPKQTYLNLHFYPLT